MHIDIPASMERGQRLLSTECILCQQRVAICPPNTLKLSIGLDLAGVEHLQERPSAPGRVAWWHPKETPRA